MRLENKRAVVTGANRSIGRAIAKRFAEEGADVVISYRSDKKGALEVVAYIKSIGRRAEAIYADFSSEEGVEVFFAEALSFLGTVDILVNNVAGYDTKDLLSLDAKSFNHLFQVAVTTSMLLSKMVATHLIQRKSPGSIINISSMSGTRPIENRTAVACSKAAMNMLTKTSALELGKHNIRVNALAPGSTPYDDSEDWIKTTGIPLPREGRPEDHASAALFLATDESSWITGLIMSVDGGHSIALNL